MGVFLLGLSACWIGAGSVGLLAGAFRHVLIALVLVAMGILAWPGRIVPSKAASSPNPSGWPIPGEKLAQAAGILVLVILFAADSLPVLNLLAVVLALAGLASLQQDRLRNLLTCLALAALVFAVHRLAVFTIPLYWRLADWIGRLLGWLGGRFGGQPLEVGAIFGGVDFLVLSFAWLLIWRRRTGPFGWKGTLGLAIALFLGHLLYLAGLSWTPILRDNLPPPPPRPEYHVYLPPPWSWSEALKSLLPWNFPWVGLAIYLTVLGLAARWIGWPKSLPLGEDETSAEYSLSSSAPVARKTPSPGTVWKEIALEAGPVVLVLLWGGLMFFWGTPGNLAGKKLLAYTPNPQDWTRPLPDRYARSEMGRFGMLPELVASLGGQWSYTTRLAEKDLQQTDVVLLLGNIGPFPREVANSLQQYVEGGGSLFVACSGGTSAILSGSEQISLPELLAEWGIKFRYETGVPVWGDWAEGLLLVSHPAVFPLAQARHPLQKSLVGWDRPGSLELHWPASPLLVGLWGYGDPGREAAQSDFLPRYDPGERLGDVVLAAETRLGLGRVVVLASPECLQTENLPISYLFVGRLLGYLAHRGASSADWWRQIVGLFCGGLMLVLLACRPRYTVLAVTAAVLGGMILVGWQQTSRAGRVLLQPPGGGRTAPTASGVGNISDAAPNGAASSPEREGVALLAPKGLPLAYIDASHMEAYSLRPWHPDGLGRLFISLMQAGYLPLLAPDAKPDRLQTAAVWLSIGPARRFSGSEQSAIQEHVQNGGNFIAMAGAEDAEALRPLLDAWRVRIPRSPVGPGETEPEAEPIGLSPGPGESPDNYGRLRTYYLNAKHYGRGDYMLAVTLYAPWPVEAETEDADVLVRGYEDTPIVIHRHIGGGGVVVIGDTYFATNKNFDETAGSPTAGMIENAHFWRWMLSRVRGREEWIPPDPKQWQTLVPPEEMTSEPMPPEAP
ncbi:MAG TPA: hypothetical protein PK777_00160 [Thermoguttaceae bacterium]|nr:hypothetical protein [Thermoguttaceae bacterium]